MTDGGTIGTTNLLECIAFIVHDPKAKRAALAHIDKLTDMKSINTMFDVIDAGNPIDVYLVGSKQASRQTAGRLIEQTQRHATESGRAITLRGVDFNAPTHMCFDAATAAITPTRPHLGPDVQQRFARATDDPRHISPLMPHNINGLTIDNFAGDTDAFHQHLHENRRVIATTPGEDTRLQPGATSTTLGTIPAHGLPAPLRDTFRKPAEPGQGKGA